MSDDEVRVSLLEWHKVLAFKKEMLHVWILSKSVRAAVSVCSIVQ